MLSDWSKPQLFPSSLEPRAPHLQNLAWSYSDTLQWTRHIWNFQISSVLSWILQAVKSVPRELAWQWQRFPMMLDFFLQKFLLTETQWSQSLKRVFCDGRSSIHSQLDLTMMQRKALLDEEHCLFKDHTEVIKQDVLKAVSTVRRGGTVWKLSWQVKMQSLLTIDFTLFICTLDVLLKHSWMLLF